MSRSGQYTPSGVILNTEHCGNQPCALCGERSAYESHYGDEMGLCSGCAERAANLYWKAHSGEFLTWVNDRTPRPSKQNVSAKVKWQVLRHHAFTCNHCGAQDRPMHVDHITPRARGGGNEIENLQALCDRCNMRKGAA